MTVLLAARCSQPRSVRSVWPEPHLWGRSSRCCRRVPGAQRPRESIGRPTGAGIGPVPLETHRAGAGPSDRRPWRPLDSRFGRPPVSGRVWSGGRERRPVVFGSGWSGVWGRGRRGGGCSGPGGLAFGRGGVAAGVRVLVVWRFGTGVVVGAGGAAAALEVRRPWPFGAGVVLVAGVDAPFGAGASLPVLGLGPAAAVFLAVVALALVLTVGTGLPGTAPGQPEVVRALTGDRGHHHAQPARVARKAGGLAGAGRGGLAGDAHRAGDDFAVPEQLDLIAGPGRRGQGDPDLSFAEVPDVVGHTGPERVDRVGGDEIGADRLPGAQLQAGLIVRMGLAAVSGQLVEVGVAGEAGPAVGIGRRSAGHRAERAAGCTPARSWPWRPADRRPPWPRAPG